MAAGIIVIAFCVGLLIVRAVAAFLDPDDDGL